jgi:hypothetical protein
VGKYVEVDVRGGNQAGSTTTPSALVGPVTASLPVSTEAPQISGTLTDGSTLEATKGSFSGAPAPTTTFQWLRCSAFGTGCSSIPGATSQEYVLTDSDVGHDIEVEATGTNEAGSASAASDPAGPVSAVPPTNTAAPSLSGTATDGQTLTASPGTWSGAPAPTYSYQWERCTSSIASCVAISGATASTYALTDGDVGDYLVADVTASNASYYGGSSASALSDPSGTVEAVPPASTQAPSISGTDADGSTLTADPGTFSGAPAPTVGYQWERCNASGSSCSAISGATASTYVLTDADVGGTVRVVVTASNASYPGGGEAEARSAATPTIDAVPPANTGVPAISGTAQEEGVLTATPGTWTGAPAPTYSYQWQLCQEGTCMGILGATASTYTLTLEDVGTVASPITVRVKVTASNASYPGGGEASASSAQSAPVSALVPVGTEAPQVVDTTGSAWFVGDHLTGTAGSFSGTDPLEESYQWMRCDSLGTDCVAISGATSQSYTLTAADVGSTLVLTATASNASLVGGGEASISSSPTPVVTGAGPAVTTQAATSVSATGATLHAEVDPQGLASTYSFDYGTTLGYGSTTTSGPAGEGSSTVGETTAVTGLTPNTLYHYRANGSNELGTTHGSDATFTTKPASEAAPSISGTTTDDDTLTASPGTWGGDASISYSYQWESCDSAGTGCSTIFGATSATYALGDGDVGTTLKVTVTATNATGQASATSSASGVVQAVAPVNSQAPSISGTATDGDTLHATHGTWSGAPAPTYAYQWQRDSGTGGSFVSIAGATSTTYDLTDADVGFTVRVAVTASNAGVTGGGEATADSVASTTVQAVVPVSTEAPLISGSAKDGSTLTTSTGTFTGAPAPTYSYEWERDSGSGGSFVPIAGATASTYALTDADVGYTVRAIVTASNSSYPGGGEAQGTSSATTTVLATVPASQGAPTISGTTQDGSDLTATHGAWSGAPTPTYTYQWQVDTGSGGVYVDVPGATGTTLALTDADVGHHARVVVTASNSSYPGGGEAQATSAASSLIDAVAPANSTIPTISGTAQDGSQLSATAGTWSGAPAPTLGYQWLLCDATGASCAPIAGATEDTYTPTQVAQVGGTLRVRVTASNASYPGGGEAQAQSTASSVIQAVPPASTTPPVVSGTTTDGQALTTTTGSFSGAPTPSYSYEWERSSGAGGSFVVIAGATAPTYTLTDADVGYTVRSVVVASNASYAGGSTAQRASSASSAVVAVPAANSAAPTISGQALDGSTLTADAGTWTGAPAPSYGYQWLSCSATGQSCSPIVGATSATYGLGDGDVGHTLEVQVTGSNVSYLGGASALATSGVTGEVQVIPAANSAVPAISGTPQDGQTLTAAPGTWSGAPAPALSYQWQEDSGPGGSFVAISGATASTYGLGDGDLGLTVRVVVTGSNAGSPGGASVAATSIQTVTVQAAPAVVTTAPAITDSTSTSWTVGDSITGTTGSFSGAPRPQATYQWQRCQSGTCTDIEGATSLGYTTTSADVGYTLRLAETATNASYPGGASVTSYSNEGPAISAPSEGHSTGPALSTDTAIQATGTSAGSYVQDIDAQALTVVITPGTLASQLVASLAATDGSAQRYEVLGPDCATPVTGEVLGGDCLRVVAADGTATASYLISLGAAPLCTRSALVLTDVSLEDGGVQLAGVASPALDGDVVELKAAWSHRVVARARVEGGTFAVLVKAPPATVIRAGHARYEAVVPGVATSPALKLTRRLELRRIDVTGASLDSKTRVLTLRGVVRGPLPSGRHTLILTGQEVASCQPKEQVLLTSRYGRRGAFTVRLRLPQGTAPVVYRLQAVVSAHAGSHASGWTYTLPLAYNLPVSGDLTPASPRAATPRG